MEDHAAGGRTRSFWFKSIKAPEERCSSRTFRSADGRRSRFTTGAVCGAGPTVGEGAPDAIPAASSALHNSIRLSQSVFTNSIARVACHSLTFDSFMAPNSPNESLQLKTDTLQGYREHMSRLITDWVRTLRRGRLLAHRRATQIDGLLPGLPIGGAPPQHPVICSN